MDLPNGVRARTVDTDRLQLHVYEAGPDDGVPVVLLHGNLSTGRFYEPVMAGEQDRYRFLVPDMRGFGRTQRVPIDATRGLRDWADDVDALLRALGVDRPAHLLGWSTGGAAVAAFAQERPVASLVLVDPVSPYGYGGVRDDGTPCAPDFAGSGGGTGNPDLAARIAAGDRSSDSPVSPRSVLRSAYVAPGHVFDPAWEDVLVDEVLLSVTGDDGYPGDATSSPHWPGTAPGARGILNALSPQHCDWSGIVDVQPQAAGAVGAGRGRRRRRRQLTARVRAPSAPPGSSRAGPARTSSRRSRWCSRRALCSTATATPAGACRWRCSPVRGTGPSSTRQSGSASCCSDFLDSV
jgi:pimeloyl-ACP methyl ester carboxylesterase